MENFSQTDSLASIARIMPIDLQKRAEAALTLALTPAPKNKTTLRDFSETIRLRYRADIFLTLANELKEDRDLDPETVTIDQMEGVLRDFVIDERYRILAPLLDGRAWRKLTQEIKHDIAATAIETTQEYVRKHTTRKPFLPDEIGLAFAQILNDLSNTEDVEEEDFL